MDGPSAFGRIIRGELFLQSGNECIEPALCGCERESGFEACDGCPKCACTARPRRQQHAGKPACGPYFGVPYFGGAALIVKIRGHDADDKVNVVVETQGSAEDVRVGAEVPLPKPVADDHFKVEARGWIVGMEYAA